MTTKQQIDAIIKEDYGDYKGRFFHNTQIFHALLREKFFDILYMQIPWWKRIFSTGATIRELNERADKMFLAYLKEHHKTKPVYQPANTNNYNNNSKTEQ